MMLLWITTCTGSCAGVKNLTVFELGWKTACVSLPSLREKAAWTDGGRSCTENRINPTVMLSGITRKGLFSPACEELLQIVPGTWSGVGALAISFLWSCASLNWQYNRCSCRHTGIFEGIKEKERAGKHEAEGNSALADGGWVLGAGIGGKSLHPEFSLQLWVFWFSGASLAATVFLYTSSAQLCGVEARICETWNRVNKILNGLTFPLNSFRGCFP